MPVRPGLDDDPDLNELIGLWRAGQADLVSRQAGIEALAREAISSGDRVRAGRLRIAAERLEVLGDSARHVADDLARSTGAWIDGGGIQRAYQTGASRLVEAGIGSGSEFTAAHRRAVTAMADDLYDDVLTATGYIDRNSKEFVRRVGRQMTAFNLTGGETPVQTARRFEREIGRHFRANGVDRVRYADGSRHGFGEYAEMLLRTKTGVAHNAGTVNHSRLAGITVLEILDGSACGLTTHTDPMLANGMLVPLHVAQDWPLSHPNCRRAFAPRPDLGEKDLGGQFNSVVSPEARADQTAFEEALRDAQSARQSGRSNRRSRPSRPRRTATRPSRTRSRPTQTDRRASRAARERRRAEIERKREEWRAQYDRVEAGEVLATGNAPESVLRRYGVNADQWAQGRVVAQQIKRDIRQMAEREADTLGEFLQTADLGQLTRPPRLRRTVDAATGRERYVRDSPGYDWLEQLDEPELARIRTRYTDSDLYSPDVVADQVRRKTNLDLTDDEAMDWLADRWLQEDALRSVASGRVPKYGNPNNLIPADYEMAGYDLVELFGQNLDDAAGHVARVQADEAATFARRALGEAREGPAPWKMDPVDYAQELDELTEFAATVQGEVPDRVRLRLRELAPPEIDDGQMAPIELFEQIRLTARAAGYDPGP